MANPLTLYIPIKQDQSTPTMKAALFWDAD